MTGPSPAADEERRLVLLAMAGGESAFQALVQRHQAGLRTLLRRTCGDPVLADDLAQEAFLKAWLNLGQLRAADGFAAWLRRIAINAAMDAGRRRTPQGHRLDDDCAAPDRDVLGEAQAPARRIDLDAALMSLSLPARLCILLFHGEQMSHGEIAAETGMPVGTVKSHIARATPVLRNALSAWRNPHG